MKKVGISINFSNDTTEKHGLFCNGLQQNIFFLYNLYKNIGYDVYFVSNTIFPNSSYQYLDIYNIKELEILDVYIEVGVNMPKKDLLYMKEKGVYCIYLALGNLYIYHTKNMLYNKEEFRLDTKHIFDKVWILGDYKFSIDYYTYIHKNENIQVSPFIWEPTFLETYTGTFDKKNINIGIFESNLTLEKSSFVPMMICDRAKKYCKSVYVFGSKKYIGNRLFQEFAKCSSLVKENKISFEGRHKFVPMMNTKCNVVVSFNQNWGLNYVLLECLYLGIPLIHNSPFFKEYGYYYEGYDITSASNHIIHLYNNGFDKEAYIEKNKTILHKNSLYNSKNMEFYKKELCSKKIQTYTKKIGLSITLDNDNPNSLYSNGINQNILFLYHLYEKQGYQPYLISNYQKKTISYYTKTYNILSSSSLQSLYLLDTIIQIGHTIPTEYIKECKKQNILCIKLFLGNAYIMNTKYMLYYKDSTFSLQDKEVFDKIWILGDYEFSIDYYKYICNNKNVKVSPFIWEPTFLETYTGTFNKKNINIGIFESNFALEKSSFVPIMICDRAKKYCNHVHVFCSNNLTKNTLFQKFAKCSSLVKENKISFEGRHKFVPMMNTKCNVVVSFNQNWGLNYVLLECLYLGIPLIHNSPFFKEYGYYYEGYDITSASNHIIHLYNNGFDKEAYLEKNKTILHKYSLHNTKNMDFFVKNSSVL